MNFDLANVLWPVPTASADTRTEYDYEEGIDTLVAAPCRVLLFNDDHHTFDEVIDQVCKATACSATQAESVAWEVHTTGKAVVFEGELFDCIQVSAVLEEIALHTQVLT